MVAATGLSAGVSAVTRGFRAGSPSITRFRLCASNSPLTRSCSAWEAACLARAGDSKSAVLPAVTMSPHMARYVARAVVPADAEAVGEEGPAGVDVLGAVGVGGVPASAVVRLAEQ